MTFRTATRWLMLLTTIGALIGWPSAQAANPAATPEKVSFNFDIRPILSDRCFFCHGPDDGKRKAKLRLDTEDGATGPRKGGPAIVRGKPDESELIKRILSTDPEEMMPPPESHLSVTDAEKALLKRWIEQGAPWGNHWAFESIRKVSPPKVFAKAWPKNDIDRFVLARLDREGLKPQPEATKERLIRRLSFDLTGLPPSVEEIDAFLADTSPKAYEKVVDRLLASPTYGERMANDWMDLARYADTYGYQSDVEVDFSPWRDWVIGAFNRNLRYDQFITWQLAGDLLPAATDEQRLATAFNRLHRQTNEGGSIEEEFRQEYVADRVHTMGTAMLGLTLECARCHDHKYDPIGQRDYYALGAFFNSIDESGLYSHFTRATPAPTLLLYKGDEKQRHARLKADIAKAENELPKLMQRTTKAQGRAGILPAPVFRNSETIGFIQSTDGQAGSPPYLSPVAAFNFDAIVGGKFTNSVGTNAASLSDNPQLTPGRVGQAVRFSGDNEVVCRNVGDFSRTQPFSLALWLKPASAAARQVVLHHSRAWSDSGSRGYELVLENGKPYFGLIHFWPGNAIAIRAKQPLPTNDWSHLTLTYDGSSHAAGLRLYLNGRSLETKVIRDNLFKDIQHRREWGDSEVGNIHLTLGGRFRDNGFKDGAIDELQVFSTALTEVEAASLVKLPASALAPASGIRHQASRFDTNILAATLRLKVLRDQENTFVTGLREIMTMEELPKPRETHLLKRGAYDSPGEIVIANTPQRIFGFASNLPRNRLGLAKWMTDSKNPLTARVAVNRVWKLHFGRGLVNTMNDFGSQGELPTHPDLLDWLARRFIDTGWDRKALHKLVVMSATYRQATEAPRDQIAADPDNRLLGRGPKHRLAAEQIRDAALAVSGTLNRQIGGPSVKPYQPAGVWEEAGTGKVYTQDKGDKLYRRSLYTFWRRTAPPPSMLSFDAVTREVCTAKREITATPLQALVLLNDPQFLEAARLLAEKLLRAAPTNLDARINEGFRAVTGRAPNERELAVLRRLYDEQRTHFTTDTTAAAKLLKTGERPADASLSQADLAATAVLVSTLMNHDEFVMKR